MYQRQMAAQQAQPMGADMGKLFEQERQALELVCMPRPSPWVALLASCTCMWPCCTGV